MELDHAFECVGGAGSGKAIDQIIDFIKPEGTISILGVSEYPVPINTRMIWKRIESIRKQPKRKSGFEKTVELYREHPEIINYLSNIVGAVIPVRSIADMKKHLRWTFRSPLERRLCFGRNEVSYDSSDCTNL